MTMTFEPFTPAGATGEQRQYDGRRRASEPAAAPAWDEPSRWNEPASDPWAEPAPPAQRRFQEWEQPQQQGWVEDPQWQVPQQRQPQAPRWHEEVAAPVVAEPEPEPEPRRSSVGGRIKPLVIGVVVLLLLVAGWQAYRIESMSDHNQSLASGLAAEKDRTDRLEQQLAGVFDPEAVSSKVLPSVFRVRAGSFTGTAFSVGRKAKANESNLMTNYHVVAEVWTDGGRKVSLERGSTRITATIVDVDKAKDLALLHADTKIAGLATAPATVKPGQQVVVVGAPLGLDDTVTTGVISAYRPDDTDGPTIQFDAPINPGNSGGPVVNATGQVVGLATAKAKDAEGIGLAIPVKTACATFTVC
ncbi:S1C family serine protease [Paractinoplanes atraurantiacus]|uniref:Putative serine protease PepD n=1 Tax=Paractinoplanes atraurantiacus TaxID=1036182 RepID=A0A285IP52_9ACTN|nr:S1C family serine protease [Actinoplanes atraurantiacus]SNY49507.1 putative serine protease PepD [Actinoplanes atraurantiacus]